MSLQQGNILDLEAFEGIEQVVDKYNDFLKTIHSYFEYEEDWVRIPLDDCRGCHWMLVGSEEAGTVVYRTVNNNR